MKEVVVAILREGDPSNCLSPGLVLRQNHGDDSVACIIAAEQHDVLALLRKRVGAGGHDPGANLECEGDVCLDAGRSLGERVGRSGCDANGKSGRHETRGEKGSDLSPNLKAISTIAFTLISGDLGGKVP